MALIIRVYRHVARIAVLLVSLFCHCANLGKWIGGFEQGARVHAPLQAVEDGFRCRAEPDYEVLLPHRGTVIRIEYSPAAGADDLVPLGADFPHDALLDRAEVNFALVLKDLGNPLLFLPLDLVVGVNEPPPQPACQDSAYGRFARAREADEYYALYCGSPSMYP